MQVYIWTNNRSDYNAVAAAIVGDSKHTMETGRVGNLIDYTYHGTMTDSDYHGMVTQLASYIPTTKIVITTDKRIITIDAAFVDENDDDGYPLIKTEVR